MPSSDKCALFVGEERLCQTSLISFYLTRIPTQILQMLNCGNLMANSSTIFAT